MAERERSDVSGLFSGIHALDPMGAIALLSRRDAVPPNPLSCRLVIRAIHGAHRKGSLRLCRMALLPFCLGVPVEPRGFSSLPRSQK